MAALFESVADGMARAIADAGSSRAPRFELEIAGPEPDASPAAIGRPGAGNPHDGNRDESRVIASACRLESALDALHDQSGFFVCFTRGMIAGPLFEIALMSDHHVMHPEAILVPGGLFDSHVPRLHGWSRLIERAGAARAASMLLGRSRVDAAEALVSGLCETHEAGPRADDPSADPVFSSIAARLAQEISERTTRTGGMTPRQTRVLESAAFALAFSCGDPREGIAAFFSNRTARFTHGNTRGQDPVKG